MRNIRKMIAVSNLLLDLENPRLDTPKNENDAIEKMLTEEQILSLAKDIANNGLSKLDVIGVIKSQNSSKKYIVLEGNRRVCALKLLLNPSLAPKQHQSFFRKLASGKKISKQIEVTSFADRNEADEWIKKLHGGQQNGVGRKSWDAQQKARAYGNYQYSTKILEFLRVGNPGINVDDVNISTLERYLEKPAFRDLFTKNKDSGKLVSVVSKDCLVMVMNTMIEDMESGQVNSRTKSEHIQNYYDNKIKPLLNGNSSEPWDLSPSGADEPLDSNIHKENYAQDLTSRIAEHHEPSEESPKIENKGRIKEPTVKFIRHSKDVEEALKKLDNFKLQRLYYSICKVNVLNHTQLVTVGIWSFFESLLTLCGKELGVNFLSFINSYLQKDSVLTKEAKEALSQIHSSGNSTKHNATYGQESPSSIRIQMETLESLIVRLCDAYSEQKTNGNS